MVVQGLGKSSESEVLTALGPQLLLLPVLLFVAGAIPTILPVASSTIALTVVGAASFSWLLKLLWMWRGCRQVTLILVSVVDFGLASWLALVGTLRPMFADGIHRHLASLMLVVLAYTVCVGFGMWRRSRTMTRGGASSWSKRHNWQDGLYDLHGAIMAVRNLQAGKVSGPGDKRREQYQAILRWAAMLIPILGALNIAFVDEMSKDVQILYGMLGSYLIALLFGAMSSAGIYNAWWYRRWEKENGKPMLINGLQGRYHGSNW